MPLLKVADLHKRYGRHISVDGISFEIESGRCVALLGPNGAGKTTTLRMLAGLLPPTSGRYPLPAIVREQITAKHWGICRNPRLFTTG